MIGGGELIVILCVVLILFGGKKLPEFARSLGEGIREFKKACNGVEETPPRCQHHEKPDTHTAKKSDEENHPSA